VGKAAKAKDAAREATGSRSATELGSEALRLAGDAKEFLSAVQQSRGGRRDFVCKRADTWPHNLSKGGVIGDSSDADTLKSCVNEISTASIRLTVEGIPPDPSKREELIVLAHSIHRAVCELAGRMERRSEGR